MKNKIIDISRRIGFWEIGSVDMNHLRYYPEVRRICEQNTCRNYGKSWACPPAVGTLAECQQRVEQFIPCCCSPVNMILKTPSILKE